MFFNVTNPVNVMCCICNFLLVNPVMVEENTNTKHSVNFVIFKFNHLYLLYPSNASVSESLLLVKVVGR